MVSPHPSVLTVHYSQPVAWAFLALGAFNLVGGLLTQLIINFVLGVVFVVLGALYFTRPYFTYDVRTRTLQVIAPIGSRRTFQGSDGNALVVEGGRIVLVRGDGKRKKLPVARWMARGPEWEAVVTSIGQASTAA